MRLHCQGAGNKACPPKVLEEKQHAHCQEIMCWEDAGSWLGYLQEFPDYWTQGESFEDLEVHLGDL